jgi:hypothetical protein
VAFQKSRIFKRKCHSTINTKGTPKDKVEVISATKALSDEVAFTDDENNELDGMIAFEVQSIEYLKLFCHKSRELQLEVRAIYDPNITPTHGEYIDLSRIQIQY